MRILTNHPLESFEPRSRLLEAGVEILTWGPPHRMRIGPDFFPLDVPFDPEHEPIEDLLARVPPGFVPDLLLIYWPDQDPIPRGLERCPIPTVAVLSDYNLTFTSHEALWPFFDRVVCDRRGVGILGRLPFAQVDWWCQYSFRTPVHRVYPDVERAIDVAFLGNLNPAVQAERMPWLRRIKALADRVRVVIDQGPSGAEYGRILSATRIGFNRSIRGEMNLRAFEVPACGALLLMEQENREVRDFLEPDRECVLYGADDLEQKILWLLEHENERAAIAARGHARIQEHSYRSRLRDLQTALAVPTRRPRPAATPFERHLLRGTSMLTTWANGDGAASELVAAARLQPGDPRPHNALACDFVRRGGKAQEAYRCLLTAVGTNPRFVPARLNLAWLLTLAGEQDKAAVILEQLARWDGPASYDGQVLPIGFAPDAVRISNARMHAVEQRDPEILAHAFRDLARERLAAIAATQAAVSYPS